MIAKTTKSPRHKGMNQQEIPSDRLHEIGGGVLIVLDENGNVLGRTIPFLPTSRKTITLPWIFRW